MEWKEERTRASLPVCQQPDRELEKRSELYVSSRTMASWLKHGRLVEVRAMRRARSLTGLANPYIAYRLLASYMVA